MLDELCKLNHEHSPLPNIPLRYCPPTEAELQFFNDDKQLQQTLQLSVELQRQDIQCDWGVADAMVTQQRTKRLEAFRDVYTNAFDLPFAPTDYQRLIRNTAINVMHASLAKPADVLKATQMLGDTAPVQAFVAEKTLNINVNQSSDTLRDNIRLKIEQLLAINP